LEIDRLNEDEENINNRINSLDKELEIINNIINNKNDELQKIVKSIDDYKKSNIINMKL
jgi:predicted  nucleic acid-binding Zn-ribbon protein